MTSIYSNNKRRATINKNNVKEICKIMTRNYESIRESVGLFSHNDDEDLGLDSLFMKLRPKSPYKLSEMLNLTFKPKNADIRLVSRKFKSKKPSADEVKKFYMYNKINDDIMKKNVIKQITNKRNMQIL